MVFKAYLSHHGIKGQKWGVENGPPYPLNDTVKAIAFRGGRRKDGSYIEGLTAKDVKKARKLVDKHMNTMTEDEIKEYKDRLMAEKNMGLFMHPKSEKLKENLSDAAINMVTDSVKSAGTKMLTNLEVNAVGQIVGKVFGEQAAAMITDGVTQYQMSQNARKKETEDREYQLRRDQQDQSKLREDRDFEASKTKYADERADKEYARQQIEREYKDRQDDTKYKRDQAERDYKDKMDQLKYDRGKDAYQREKDKIENEKAIYKNATERMKAETDRYDKETNRMKAKEDIEKQRLQNESAKDRLEAARKENQIQEEQRKLDKMKADIEKQANDLKERELDLEEDIKKLRESYYV